MNENKVKAADPSHSHTLKDWKARRSGKNITITGLDAVTGEAKKLVDIEQLEPAAGHGILAQQAGSTVAHVLVFG